MVFFKTVKESKKNICESLGTAPLRVYILKRPRTKSNLLSKICKQKCNKNSNTECILCQENISKDQYDTAISPSIC